MLALDTTNTVVHRCDPSRRFDRFDDPAEIPRFAAAASVFRREEVGRPLAVANAEAIAGDGARICRESIDALFRGAAAGEPLDASALAAFLRACAAALDGRDELSASADAPFGEAGAPLPFETALAVSALSLLNGASLKKAEGLPELQLAVSRQKPQFQPLVVRYGGLRKPGQGEASLSPSKTAKGENRWLENCRFR